MSLFKNFSIGLNTYSDAHKLIVKHRLWNYVLLPGVINLLLIICIFILGYYTGTYSTKKLIGWFGLSTHSSDFLNFLSTIISFLIHILVYFFLFYLYFLLYKYVVLMIMSPLLSIISEKTDEMITGNKYKFDFKKLVKDIIRGHKIVLRNLLKELFFTFLFFFLSYIPIIGIISPCILFVISIYYYGFSMIDYSNERMNLSVRESVKFVYNNKGFSIANGLVFYLLLLIPFVGLMIAPSYSVIAATIGVHKISRNENNFLN
ncbi:MAG TPA: EI24 domain-containing protein [Bacteroidales bacterium]|nr:EI24 domain-containing protein [Bacteroidales bacterium]